MKKRKRMKTVTLVLTICIMLLMSISAFAIPTNSQDNSSIPPQNQAHQPIINPPPSGWDALTASDEELAKYNYPPRPTDAQDLSEWKNIVKGRWIYPEFKVSTSGRIGQAIQIVPNLKPNLPASLGPEIIDSTTIGTTNWSGVITNPGTRARVTGYWRQPAATAATSNRPAYSSQWIGLGGEYESVLIQMGTEANIYEDSSGSYHAWYEIVGTNLNPYQIDIANFSHMPGDTIYADIKFTKGSSGSAYFYMSDSRTGDVTSFTIPNIQFNNNLTTAEWIFERPNIGQNPAPNLTKPDVAYVHFAQCKSGSTPSGTPSVVSGSASTTEYATLMSLDWLRTLATPGSSVDAGGGYDNIWFDYN